MTYLVLRAIYVQPLHDEIATFFRYIQLNELFPWHSEWSANNHYLNSLLSWVFYKLFGLSPLSLRLASLLFFPLYFHYIAKIAGLIKDQRLYWGFLVTLLFAHNYFEFFGISRGYGMSMALLMGAVWHFMDFLKARKFGSLTISLVLISIGAYANLNLVNTFIILAGLGTLSLLTGRDGGKPTNAKILSFLLLSGSILSFFILLLLRLQAEGELYYGRSSNFYNTLVVSLMKLLTGSEARIFPVTMVFYFGLTFMIFISKWIKNKSFQFVLKAENTFLLLIVGNVAGIILENKLFGTNLQEDRTGLFYFPLLLASVFFSLDSMRVGKYLKILPILPLLFFPVHFLGMINISWSSMENHEIPQKFYDRIEASKTGPNKLPTVQGSHMRTMRWNYLNYTNRSELPPINFSQHPAEDADFQIVFPQNHPDWQLQYHPIDSCKQSGLYLLERNRKLTKKLITESELLSAENNNLEFFEFFRDETDTLAGQSLYFEFGITLLSRTKPFQGWLVVAISNSKNETIRYDYIPLNWYRENWENGKPFICAAISSNLPKGKLNIIAYMWNVRKDKFQLKAGKVSIYQLQ